MRFSVAVLPRAEGIIITGWIVQGRGAKMRFYLKSPSRIDIWKGNHPKVHRFFNDPSLYARPRKASGSLDYGCAQVTYDSPFQHRGSFAMKKTTALWTLTLLVSLSSGATAGEVANHSGRSANLTLVDRMQAPPQAAKAPAWKSREEYDAFNAMTNEKTRTRRFRWRRRSCRSTQLDLQRVPPLINADVSSR